MWLYLEGCESVELRDSTDETLATFTDPETVFTDPTAYPATETDGMDFSEWTAIKRPVIPSVSFGEGGLDRDMIDVIAITENILKVLGGDQQIPIDELLHEDAQRARDGEGRLY